jgi:effector-binding domain-containing protein
METGTPRVDHREALPYMGIRERVTMADLAGDVIPALVDEVFAWLDREGIDPQGAPFVRYHVIDMAAELEIEVAVPVRDAVDGDGRVNPGRLPAGRYASLEYRGANDGVAGNRALIEWAAHAGLEWDDFESERGHGFVGRYETLLTDPADEPDPAAWVTEVAIKLK